MLLSNLITPNDDLKRQGADVEIGGITADSRNVKKGFLFAAVPGTLSDGRQFINDAIAKGAVALLVPADTDLSALPASVGVITADDARSGVSKIAARFYSGQPRTIAAVTGTSGKTSTVHFTRELWSLNGHQAASLGTLGLVSPTETRYGSLTTPDAITLHQVLNEITEQGITHAAMEASSHGIELHRLDGVRLQAAAFTNLSRDHLDYHQTMKQYFLAKLRLFTEILPEGSAAVLNADIPEFDELVRACHHRKHRIISFGKHGTDIHLHKTQIHPRGQVVHMTVMGKHHEILLPIIGGFQVWNSLCALGLAIGCDEDADRTVANMEKLTSVVGRLEYIGATPQGGSVFVDYAHKPDALENVLNTMRPHVAAHQGARLHIIVGCGGNRDKGKRPIMGGIAQRLADVVIITDDNPRREDAATIRQEILAGCTAGPNLREIGDRRKAIQEGIAALQKDDVLVIAGKGHEEGQIVGDKVLPFNDAEVARQVLRGEK